MKTAVAVWVGLDSNFPIDQVFVGMNKTVGADRTRSQIQKCLTYGEKALLYDLWVSLGEV